MPDNKFTSWVHGSAMQVEYLPRITAVRHTGPFVRIEGAGGQNTWVHFPIPTPSTNNGTRTKAEADPAGASGGVCRLLSPSIAFFYMDH